MMCIQEGIVLFEDMLPDLLAGTQNITPKIKASGFISFTRPAWGRDA